ncbi:MAG: alpha/beta fold hydrolase [Vulcanimicrobiaceae bacterium]
MAFFDGFSSHTIDAGEVRIHARVGGSGPPLLLLHGYPQTHVCWHAVAPLLARRFTVVCPDLRGYGQSSKPPGDSAHERYSKRAMARDNMALMQAIGFEQFAVAGHDRGGRVAYRLALDQPAAVTKLAVLDIVPTIDTFDRLDRHSGVGTYHWFFLAQPVGFPERLIGADPAFFLEHTLQSWCGTPGAFTPEAMAAYRVAFGDPASIHATCEDYRAGATFDSELDAADRRALTIGCPVLVLWGERPGLRRKPWDMLGIWRTWASDVRGHALDCGHFLPEERPAETAAALERFFA